MKKILIAGISALAAIGTALVFGFNGLFLNSVENDANSVIRNSTQSFCQPSAGILSDAPLGINITYCKCDSHGVDVVFETDLEPPYVVAVFMAIDGGFFCRDYPLDYRVVDGKSCYIPGDFLSKGYSFVQVFTESVTNSPTFRKLTQEEVDERYDKFYRTHTQFEKPLANDGAACWTEQYQSTNAVLIGDHQWGAFYPTMTNEIVLCGKGRGLSYWKYVTNFVQTAEIKSGFLYSNEVSGIVREQVSVTTNYFYEPYVRNDFYEVKRMFMHTSDGDQMYSVNGVRTFNDEHYAVTWELIDKNYKPKLDSSVFAATNSFRHAIVKHIGFFSNEVTGVVRDTQVATWTNEFVVADEPGVFRTEPQKTKLRIGDKGYWYWTFETNILDDVIVDKRSASIGDVVSGTVDIGNMVQLSIKVTASLQEVEITNGGFWSNIVTGVTSEPETTTRVIPLYDDLSYSMDAVDKTLIPDKFRVIGETNRFWKGVGMRTVNDYHKRDTNVVQTALLVQQMIFTNVVPTVESVADMVVWVTNSNYKAWAREDFMSIEPFTSYGDYTWYKVTGTKTLGDEHERDPSIVHTLEHTIGYVMSNETTGVVSEPIVKAVTNRETVAAEFVTNVFCITERSIDFSYENPETNLYYEIYGERTLGNCWKRPVLRDIPVFVEFVKHDPEIPEFPNMAETVSRTFRFGPFDTSRGCGYRIIYNDDKDQFDVMRAYSLFTNRSQEVVLRRNFKALSAHGGVRVGHDWMGRRAYVTDTNSVPDRIYWEGL